MLLKSFFLILCNGCTLYSMKNTFVKKALQFFNREKLKIIAGQHILNVLSIKIQ